MASSGHRRIANQKSARAVSCPAAAPIRCAAPVFVLIRCDERRGYPVCSPPHSARSNVQLSVALETFVFHSFRDTAGKCC